MKKTVEQLKSQIRLLNADVAYERALKEKARNYASDLSAKLDVALDRLTTIAQKRHYLSEVNGVLDVNIPAVTASEGLKKISRMQERK